MDKRFERSEKNICQAFLELLKNSSYAKITVSDICRKADCSRNTFYLHYDSKEHLMTALLYDIIANIEKSCRPVVKQFSKIGLAESRQFTDQILEAIAEQKIALNILFGQKDWHFSQQLGEVLLNASIEEAEKLNQTYNLPHLIYFTHGIVGYTHHWLKTSISLDIAQEELHQAVHFSFQK